MLNCCFQASSTFGFELTGHLILHKTLFNEFMLVKVLGLEQSKLWLGKKAARCKIWRKLSYQLTTERKCKKPNALKTQICIIPKLLLQETTVIRNFTQYQSSQKASVSIPALELNFPERTSMSVHDCSIQNLCSWSTMNYRLQSQPQKQHFLFMAKKSKRGQAPTFGTKLNFYHDKRKGHTFRHDEEKRGLPKRRREPVLFLNISWPISLAASAQEPTFTLNLPHD